MTQKSPKKANRKSAEKKPKKKIRAVKREDKGDFSEPFYKALDVVKKMDRF
ncbi:MAG: hypothetical protein JO126_05920 [Alphaproteobacteria bacterium]|nr:hypothetical protein [Alphaproteobacteria bacterium]MBV8548974.1 hypothetical protein [Alphaproteobacteria bacterium]